MVFILYYLLSYYYLLCLSLIGEYGFSQFLFIMSVSYCSFFLDHGFNKFQQSLYINFVAPFLINNRFVA